MSKRIAPTQIDAATVGTYTISASVDMGRSIGVERRTSAERLRELKALRNEDLISEEEYQEKRAAILESL